jgi:hypothetical protein
MGYVVALDQVPEQDGVEILVVGHRSEAPVEGGDLGESPGLPVVIEGSLDEQPPLGRQSGGRLDAFVVEELPEREREDLPRHRPSRIRVAISFDSMCADEPVR